MDIPQKLLNTHILNSCWSKKAYDTKRGATDAAERIAKWNQKKQEARGTSTWAQAFQMTAYECKFCNKFHLTSCNQNNWKNRPTQIKKIKLRQPKKKYKSSSNKKK